MRSAVLVVNHGRQLGRLLAEVTLSTMIEARRRMNSQLGNLLSLEDIVMLLILLRDHPRLRRWTASGERAGGGPSINGLAESLHRPFETMRRHVHALADAGILSASSDGVRMTPAFEASSTATSLIACLHDGALRFLEDLDTCGLDEPILADGTPYQPDGVAALGIELCLIPFEVAQPAFDNWAEMTIVQAIAAIGIRPVTEDIALSHRYAAEDTPPPVEIRTPVQPAEIARALDIPVSTVHRQILHAGRNGKLERVRGGICVAKALLESPDFRNARSTLVERCLLSLSRFRMRGFDYSFPGSRYIGERPARIGEAPPQ